jgi:hypothetical protein
LTTSRKWSIFAVQKLTTRWEKTGRKKSSIANELPVYLRSEKWFFRRGGPTICSMRQIVREFGGHFIWKAKVSTS